MNKPRKISDEVIIQNPYLKVSKKNYIDESGKESSFLITGHNKKETVATYVLPITSEGEIIYLKEFRYGPEKFLINFPVGILDDGISRITNCKKELEEETGYTSSDIVYLGESIIENYFEGKIFYYIARNCRKVSDQNLESGELISVHLSSIRNFEKMILENKILASKTAYSFLLAKAKGFFN